MKKIKKCFYDLETTGTDWKRHSVHQIAGIIEIDGEVVEKFDIKTQPHPRAVIEPEAMKICGVTEEQIKGYQIMKLAYREFMGVIAKYVDKFDKQDKMFLVGFNNRAFDDYFLYHWFKQNGDPYLFSLFWPDSLDVRVLASEYLQERRANMPSFKLKRVATELGIFIEEDKLHDAFYDVDLTRAVYRIVTGLDFEI